MRAALLWFVRYVEFSNKETDMRQDAVEVFVSTKKFGSIFLIFTLYSFSHSTFVIYNSLSVFGFFSHFFLNSKNQGHSFSMIVVSLI